MRNRHVAGFAPFRVQLGKIACHSIRQRLYKSKVRKPMLFDCDDHLQKPILDPLTEIRINP